MRVTRSGRFVIGGGVIAVAVGVAVWLKSSERPLREGYDPKQNELPAETRRVLETGERFVLLSLDPVRLGRRTESAAPPKATFHDYGVMGSAEIRNHEERAGLLRALYKGIADSDGSVAACFNPRHGISASLDNETVDLVICFECLSMQTYHKKADGLFTTRSPQRTFNRALKRAHLPIAKE